MENQMIGFIVPLEKEREIVNKIVNLTEDDVNIIGDDGDVLFTVKRSPQISYTEQRSYHTSNIVYGKNYDIVVPLKRQIYSLVANVPPKEKHVLYIVPPDVADAMKIVYPNRYDLVTPYDIVYDTDGNVKGYRSFCYA